MLLPAGIVGLIVVGIATAVLIFGNTGPAQPLIADTLPSRGPEDFLIVRFFREARSPHASFSMVSEGTYVETEPPGGPEGKWTDRVILNGPDWIAHLTMDMDGEDPIEESAASIGGEYFVRVGDEDEWATFDPRETIGSVSPFARISTVTEIEYVDGDTTTDGTTVHHLVVTKWIGGTYGDMRAAGIDTVLDRENRLDVWVNDAGVPLRSTWAGTVEFREGGVEYTAEMEWSTTFSDWDEDRPIKLPDKDPDSASAGNGLATQESRRPRN